MKMIELTLFILVFISVSVGHADKAVEWSIGGGGGVVIVAKNKTVK